MDMLIKSVAKRDNEILKFLWIKYYRSILSDKKHITNDFGDLRVDREIRNRDNGPLLMGFNY